MCACIAFRRIVSKFCDEIRMLNCFFSHISFVRIKRVWASARFEAFGREPVDRRLAKCDAGSFVGTSSISFTSAQSAKAHPFRCASSQNRNRVAGLRFCIFCARWRNVGFSRCTAHTLAACPERRTQRRHAPHGGERCLLRKGARMQNRSRRYPLTLLLRQAPEPLVGAALRKNAEISLCNFQRPL